MADKMTTINTPFVLGAIKGRHYAGFMDHGHKTSKEMIATIRAYADSMREEVRAIDQTADDQFVIYHHTGVHVQKNKKFIQGASS